MMKPVNFDPHPRQYPVLMYQYSGPGSQQVLDTWGISWETYMASLGYIVVCVDGRGTGGRGEAFEKCTYLKIWRERSQRPGRNSSHIWADSRMWTKTVSVSGDGAIGGYMTIDEYERRNTRIQSRSCCGRTYGLELSTTLVYTERFMRTPKENAEGYKASSAFSTGRQTARQSVAGTWYGR